MLRYLRRQARLTQRELGIAVGYSESHINRFEKNKRFPDPTTVAALFIPELGLSQEPELAARLVQLATPAAQHSPGSNEQPALFGKTGLALEPIPPARPHQIPRPALLAKVRSRLLADRHIVLYGIPGIGKTTIAGDVARELSGRMPVFWLTFTPGITTSADVVVRQIAEFLLAHGHVEVKPLLVTDRRLKAALSLDQQINLIGKAFGRQPALLCFDNAELVQDEETCLQILQHLCATTPAYLLLTARDCLSLPDFSDVPVGGLGCEEGLAFITQSVGHPLDEKQARRLLEKAGGNPMLLRLAMGKLANEQIDLETFIARLETEPQVAAYLLQTIQKRLSPAAWRLLLMLAAFQQPVNLYDAYLVELAQTLGDIDHLGEATTELQRRSLIDNAAQAHLHPLIRDYVTLTLNVDMALRQRLHRLAGDWFRDSNRDGLAAAWHYSSAGLMDLAVDEIEENKDAIISRDQAGPAVMILDEVQNQIKRLRSDQTNLLRRLLVLRGILLTGTLRVAEGEADLRQALSLASSPAVQASIVCHLAEVTNQRSDFLETLRLVHSVQAQIIPDDLLLNARLAVLESVANDMLGNTVESARNAYEALALTDRMAGLPQPLVAELRARAQFELAGFARSQRNLASSLSHTQVALASARLLANRALPTCA